MSGRRKDQTDEFAVTFLPTDTRAVCTAGDGLLETARPHGVRITADCGGRGRCRSCAVRIQGTLPEAAAADCGDFSPEEIAAGWRRACQARLLGACTVHVPAGTATDIVARGHDDGPAVVPIEIPVMCPGEQEGRWSRAGHTVGPCSR